MRFRRASSSGALARAAIAAALMLAHAACARAGVSIVEPYRTDRSPGGHGYAGYLEFGQAAFAEYPPETQVGFRVAPVKPGLAGVDFALAAWLVPGAVVTPDLDATYPIALSPQVRLAPRAGLSGLLAGGGGYILLAGGVNAGLGLVLNPNGPLSIRGDYTLRSILSPEENESELMHVVSVGISWGGSNAP